MGENETKKSAQEYFDRAKMFFTFLIFLSRIPDTCFVSTRKKATRNSIWYFLLIRCVWPLSLCFEIVQQMFESAGVEFSFISVDDDVVVVVLVIWFSFRIPCWIKYRNLFSHTQWPFRVECGGYSILRKNVYSLNGIRWTKQQQKKTMRIQQTTCRAVQTKGKTLKSFFFRKLGILFCWFGAKG